MTAVLTVTMNPAIDVSALTAEVVPTRKLRCTDVRRDPGGGGVNVARVTERLGGNCRAFYPAGGLSGRLLQRLLDEEGVASLCVETAAETRDSFTVLDEASGEQYRFVLPGAPLSQEEWQGCLDHISSLADPPDYIVASGSLPPGVPEDFYAKLARVADIHGARVVVDTSGPALRAALGQGVFLVKPNLRELSDLTGRDIEGEAEWIAASQELVRRGSAEVVALTLGHRGALLVTRDLCLRAEAVPVTVTSAVGAGDSFLAGMVWALASDRTLEEAFRYGLAAGTAALLTPGTGLARREDIYRLEPDVVVAKLRESAGGE